MLSTILANPPKRWEKLGDMVIFPQGTDTTNWPMEEVAKILQATELEFRTKSTPVQRENPNLN